MLRGWVEDRRFRSAVGAPHLLYLLEYRDESVRLRLSGDTGALGAVQNPVMPPPFELCRCRARAVLGECCLQDAVGLCAGRVSDHHPTLQRCATTTTWIDHRCLHWSSYRNQAVPEQWRHT